VISRVAESCFWLNRYVERVEVLARMLDVNLAFQLDVDLPKAECWRPLVVVTGQEADFLEFTGDDRTDDPEVVQAYLTWSEENPSSLFSSLRGARENARTIRETISLEMWQVLNGLWIWLRERGTRRLYERERHAFYVHLRDQCLLFHGTAQATMLHEDPFEFMRLGTALERAAQTARVLDVKHHSIGPSDDEVELPAEAAQWLATLRFCSGVEPFFKRPENSLSGRAVARFLLFDPAFPRSVLHNLRRARNFLGLVCPAPPSGVGQRSAALLDDTLGVVEAMDIDDVMSRGLHDLCTWLVQATAGVCEAIRADYFDLAAGLSTPAAAEAERPG
jgi:uncharacterized alpha-E superfamily protein